MSSTKTGILFFSRSPFRESLHKKIHADKQKNFQALHLLYQWVKQTLRTTGIPVVELSEKEQIGDNFGARLSQGMGKLFNAGYDRVIVVGNDCPRMDREDLLRARQQLEAGNMILGHNVLGGAYIFGISKEAFTRDTFEALPWSKPELGEALKGYLLKHGALIELEVKEDVNTPEDLFQVLTFSLRSRLTHLLQELFRVFHNTSKELPVHYSRQLILEQPFRGPPSPPC